MAPINPFNPVSPREIMSISSNYIIYYISLSLIFKYQNILKQYFYKIIKIIYTPFIIF